MSDIDTNKVGKEISKPDANARFDAWQTLTKGVNGAKPEDIKKLADDVTKQIDLHSLGLDHFHLDESKPVDAIAVQATKDHPAGSIPFLQFTDGKNTVILLPQGAEFDPVSFKQLRAADVQPAPADASKPGDPAAAKPGDPAAAKPGDPAAAKPGDPAAAKPGDPAASASDATTNLSDADKAKLQQYIQQNVDAQSVSLPVKKGEGYYQVIRRMNPSMSPEDAVKAARHMRDLNGGNVNLKVGDKLPLLSDDDKKAEVQKTMDAFSKLPADQQAQALAAAKAAFPDAPAPAAAKPADTTPAPAAAKPADASATPAPTAAKPADASATPAPKPPDGSSPDASLTPPDAPQPAAAKPADVTPPTPPVTAPDVVSWVPVLDPNSKDLQPKGDPSKPETWLYNPLAPIGLSEGQPGQTIKKDTQGVDTRKVATAADKNSETITGQIADTNWFKLHFGDTDFTTKDTLQNGKLATRDTTYDTDRVNLKFQGPAGHDPIVINGVKEVKTTLDTGTNGYTTTVYSDGKTWIFTSDEKGVVIDAQQNV
jgi:hypothetical protein